MAKKRQHSAPNQGPYFETFDQWLGCYSEEDDRNLDALYLVEEALEGTDIDAKRRKIAWPDGQRLSVIQCAKRIHASNPETPLELLESKILSWLEMVAPEHYSEQQLDELDRLTEKWIADHQAAIEKRSRTPDS